MWYSELVRVLRVFYASFLLLTKRNRLLIALLKESVEHVKVTLLPFLKYKDKKDT